MSVKMEYDERLSSFLFAKFSHIFRPYTLENPSYFYGVFFSIRNGFYGEGKVSHFELSFIASSSLFTIMLRFRCQRFVLVSELEHIKVASTIRAFNVSYLFRFAWLTTILAQICYITLHE